MNEIDLSRRALLVRVCQLPAVAALASIAGCAKQSDTAACASPDQLTEGESSLRASVRYTDDSSDPAKACQGCAYFHVSADAGQCGNCEILNGAVSAHGHCLSWSAKS